MDLNKVMLIWRITNDLELKKMWESGNSVLNFNIATNRKYKNKDWNLVEEAEFHRCVAFWVSAENINRFMNKWNKIYIEWRIRTRKWEDTNWNTRYTTEIVVENFIFLESKWWDSNYSQVNENTNSTVSDDEELPF